MINHYMYKDSFKNTTDIDFGRKMDQILPERLLLFHLNGSTLSDR